MAEKTLTIELNHEKFSKGIQKYAQLFGIEMEQVMEEVAARVLARARAYTPVGETKQLSRSWTGPFAAHTPGTIAYRIENAMIYAPIVERGLYPGVGPKTVKVGAKSLGYGLEAPAGIFSRQAIHGYAARALVDEYKTLETAIRGVMRDAWGKS